ncbi:MAG: NPCBM/NEW2 domain-containing protein [Planctomycetes bacterium]|nr:NPCBM/NEW2 domain-containing protein [Planctomycetota bacterium]MBL7039045.1 NPCBM/NEW2 domain-containing protein [Pirellulaceae bacterium]
MRCNLLILVTVVTAQTLVAVGHAQQSWQDRVLDVPYTPRVHEDKPALTLIRQDYEELEVNRNIGRSPMKIGEQTFKHGIGTHAVSHIRLRSPVPLKRFSAWIGVDNNQVTNPGTPIGSVVFSVEANRRQLYQSKVIRAGEEAVKVDVELSGAQVVDLRVGDSGNGAACDWADWAEAEIELDDGSTIPLHKMDVKKGTAGARYPFSFVYGDQHSDDVLDGWQSDRKCERLDDDRTKVTTTWSDPNTGTRLTMEAVRFSDFPAIEWLLYFENTGTDDTPVIENVQALDMTFASPISDAVPYRVHQTKGSVVNPSDFAPSVSVVDNRNRVTLSGGNGKCSAKHFPFFKIDTKDASVIVAVGWSGQWAADFQCVDKKHLHVTSGQELTHFVLRPGERVRTPRILVLNWEGDQIESNSQFRRLIYKHYAAKRNGKTPSAIPYCNTCFTRGGVWLNECNAENQISLIRAYSKLGLEALLTDAGWFEGGWPHGAGNWTPRKDAYPNGMEPVALAAKDEGMIYGLWFEPERVVAGTALHREHPDWVLSGPNPRVLLANFGRREVQDYFFDIVKGFMDMPGFRVYRQDFNMFPLEWWRRNDPPDRQGITEMKYIEGLYAYWDRIAETWPDSLRVECASGGMRIDLETVSRMHVHQKTDYWFDNDADQAHLFGLSQYLPNNVVVAHLNRLDDYSFRSTMASSLCLGWIADDPDFDVQRGKELLDRYRKLRHLLTGDWYPLMPYTTRRTEWMATQYHRADLDEGMILVFRHSESPYPAADVSLHGLKGDATYLLHYESTGETRQIKGAELMENLRLEIPEKQSSDLITYETKP